MYTRNSHHVFWRAKQEARRQGRKYLGTEHLLLGVIRQNEPVEVDACKSEFDQFFQNFLERGGTFVVSGEASPLPPNMAAKACQDCGIEVGAIREEADKVEFLEIEGPDEFPLSKDCKKVIERAIRMMSSRRKDEIEPEDLLLSILDENDETTARIFRSVKADKDSLRQELLKLTGGA